MKRLMALMIAAAVTFGGSAIALEVGEKVGPVWVHIGSVICDTAEEVPQALDSTTPYPDGCGKLTEVILAYIEALSEHEFGSLTYRLLRLEFDPRSFLGVQYGWEVVHVDDSQPI